MIQRRSSGQGAQRISQIRGANRALVLQTLRKFPQISRAELARRTGLSEGAVSRIAAELLQERFILEQGAENSTGGRPGTRLELDQSYHRAIGVDIRHWETRVSLGTLQGRILTTLRFRTPTSAKRTLDMVANHVDKLREEMEGVLLHGVGVSVRGIVDPERGMVEVGNSRQWDEAPVKASLEDKLGLPVFVDNDVRAAALAQFRSGSAEFQDSSCMLFIRVDEGVGMGIVMDGKIYRGIHQSAGEIGQMVVADSPGNGAQDRPGCLESVAANPAIFARYQSLSQENRAVTGETESRVRKICHLAMAGDKAAITAIRDCARYLGIGIANVIWCMNADVVFIDGAITDAWPIVQDAIQEQFPSGHEFQHFRSLILRPSTLGQDAGIAGALALPFVNLFETGESLGLSFGG
jgi:predicted NBD/HSP70 family sugar kinase